MTMPQRNKLDVRVIKKKNVTFWKSWYLFVYIMYSKGINKFNSSKINNENLAENLNYKYLCYSTSSNSILNMGIKNL